MPLADTTSNALSTKGLGRRHQLQELRRRVACRWTRLAFAQESTRNDPPQSATVAGQLSFPDPRLRRLHGIYMCGRRKLGTRRGIYNTYVFASNGPGLTLGIGADFWLDPNWAVGAMARFTAAVALEKEDGEHSVHGLVCPAVLLTVAYNE